MKWRDFRTFSKAQKEEIEIEEKKIFEINPGDLIFGAALIPFSSSNKHLSDEINYIRLGL